jgi:dihydroxyacetone kinase phosphotransfer subunit
VSDDNSEGAASASRVGLVLVSHVAAIAEGLRILVAQMAPDVGVEPAGGTDDGRIGTSFDLVVAALGRADTGEGAVVLYDLGSALLTTETALDLLDDQARARVRIADAPLVEGAIAAGVEAQGGGHLSAVVAAAESAGGPAPRADVEPAAGRPDRPDGSDGVLRASATLVNAVGLHARPAGALARALVGLDADVRVGRPGDDGVNARSVLSVIALGLGNGQQVEYAATGPDARRALDTAVELTRNRFGDAE